jgi:hypothetical protein
MQPSSPVNRFTVHPTQEDGERPVVRIPDTPGATGEPDLVKAIAQQGLDHDSHWFILHDRGTWFEAEFDRWDGRLSAIVELRGANSESEAVEALRAHYRKHREELAALDAKIREENATREAPR